MSISNGSSLFDFVLPRTRARSLNKKYLMDGPLLVQLCLSVDNLSDPLDRVTWLGNINNALDP